jgi:hypothetical protein
LLAGRGGSGALFFALCKERINSWPIFFAHFFSASMAFFTPS